MPTLTEKSGIHILSLGADDNRFSPDWLAAADE